MKKILTGLLMAGMLALYPSCQKDGLLTDPTDLLSTLASATGGSAVGADELPADITGYVETNYNPLEIVDAWQVTDKGYVVVLEDGTEVYFDLNGKFAGDSEKDGLHNGDDQAHMAKCLEGNALDASDLPQAATDYVANNHANASISSVVIKPNGHFGTELSDGTVLLFDTEGTHIKNCGCEGQSQAHDENAHNNGMHNSDAHDNGSHDNQGGSHVDGGSLLQPDQLPQAAQDYIANNYPAETILKAVQTYHRKYFVHLSNDVKIVFDANGNVLYDSGN